MRIINETYYGGPVHRDLSLQRVYELLTYSKKKVDKKSSELIMAWLPLINTIGVYQNWDNSWLDIRFDNNKVLRIYNTGLEKILADQTLGDCH